MTDLPIACALSERELAARRQDYADHLAKGIEHVEELEDGFAFRFAGTDRWVSAILTFVTLERSCCPFFGIEVVFEPAGGPVWLKLRGGAEAKAFVTRELGLK